MLELESPGLRRPAKGAWPIYGIMEPIYEADNSLDEEKN